jgi:hypothetical protein
METYRAKEHQWTEQHFEMWKKNSNEKNLQSKTETASLTSANLHKMNYSNT